MSRPPSNRRMLLPALVLVALTASACGSSDPGTGAPSSDGTTTAAGADPAEFDQTAYCAASLAAELAQPDIDFETATPAEVEDGLRSFAAEDLVPLLEAVEAAAPAELDGAIAGYRQVVDDLAVTGDPAVFERPVLAEAEAVTHAFDLENCDWSTADVVASDFAFAGVEGSYEPGPLSIDLTNEGDEVHELLVLKVKPGVDEAAEDLVRLSEEEAFEKVDFVGNIDPLEPGGSDYAIIQLEPGRYVVSCFLPEGAVDLDHLDAQGAPHALSGMVTEFTVTSGGRP